MSRAEGRVEFARASLVRSGTNDGGEAAWRATAADAELQDELTRRVLASACALSAETQKSGVLRLRVIVPAPARQLTNPAFFGQVRAALDAAGADAGSLVLALPHPRDSANPQLAHALLAHLRAAGIGVMLPESSCDPDGVGGLPVDALAVDVHAGSRAGKRRARQARVVEAAVMVGIPVIATNAGGVIELELLRDLGCTREELDGAVSAAELVNAAL